MTDGNGYHGSSDEERRATERDRSYKKILTFDPGAQGYACKRVGLTKLFFPLPQTGSDLYDFLVLHSPDVVVIERQVPFQHAFASARLMELYGGMRWTFDAWKAHEGKTTQLYTPRPTDWKRDMGLVALAKQLRGDKKGASIQLAKQYDPSINLRRTERCTTDDDNMAEAFLLSEWVLLVEEGKIVRYNPDQKKPKKTKKEKVT